MIVIGIGNPYRRDDGIGPSVICRLRWLGLPGVTLAASDGDAGDLVGLWEGQDLAVVVVGVRTERAAPGRVHRLSLHHPALAARTVGTYRESLGAAVETARTLDRLPRQLLLLAVEIADDSAGHGLSPVVSAAARRVTEEIVRLLLPTPNSH